MFTHEKEEKLGKQFNVFDFKSKKNRRVKLPPS